MQITVNWLKEFVDFLWDWPELVERLTMVGLEPESVTNLEQRFEGVVVGRVVECGRHPGADRLSLCQVNVGSAVQAIVCGAPNVAAGQKVPVILPGHTLPDGTRIERTRIRGVESSGMICSEIELGLGDDAAGILVLPDEVEVGAPFAAQVGLADVVVDFEVTPNRPDCLSLLGIAREVRALTGAALRLPPHDVEEAGPSAASSATIEIQDPESCPRYVGRVIRGVEVGPSPDWLQRRLQAVGQRPINNIVDATNYVMLELGQPLHAFDLGKLEDSRIVVRRARPGEELVALDGTPCRLDDEMLVIADGRRPVALAGIMGGANSEVTAGTADILLESAYFSPGPVRRARVRLGLFTEASMRFERGADVEMPPLAIDRAARLITELAGGQVAPQALDAYPRPLQPPRLGVRLARINQLLATDLEAPAATRILELLGCAVEHRGDGLEVVPPSFRPDLQREVDLIEEVGRIYGYDRIEGSETATTPLARPVDPAVSLQRRLRTRLSGLGLDEVVSNTLVEQRWLQLAGTDGDNLVRLANPPTEDQAVLRPSLVPSLLDVARRNFNQRAPTVGIFELGKCFGLEPEGGPGGESLRLGVLWAGRRSASTWQTDQREIEILDLKGLVEALLEDADVSYVPDESPFCRRGLCARLEMSGCDLGYMGQAGRALCAGFDIERPVYIIEVDFQVLLEQWRPGASAFRPLAKFPPIERDLAVLLRQEIGAAQAIDEIRAAAPDLIESVELFDLYEGDQIAAGHKSLAFSLRLRSREKTLEDREANQVIDQILSRLREAFGAELRPG